MTAPLTVLGLPASADEAAIRSRYLELVREFPPEQAPARFAEIRAAYDSLRDRDAVLTRRLFDPYPGDHLGDFLAAMNRGGVRKRFGLAALVAVGRE